MPTAKQRETENDFKSLALFAVRMNFLDDYLGRPPPQLTLQQQHSYHLPVSNNVKAVVVVLGTKSIEAAQKVDPAAVAITLNIEFPSSYAFAVRTR